MVNITLPDNTVLEFAHAVTGFDVANKISKSLAKAAVVIEVNGELKDMSALIDKSASVRILTTDTPEGVEVIRHSCAHLLAQAVKILYPKVQVTIGPVIENGFYYDFAKEEPFVPQDLLKIEKQMQKIVQQKLPLSHKTLSRNEAVKYFGSIGEDYKAQIIKDIPADEALTLYTQGDFTDLCRGPHVPNTGHIKAFKLTKIAGAYWRGDSNNEMLQRIYGTAWANKEDLTEHLNLLEEAKKRDHRVLAKSMGLFHIQQEAPGMIFWHEKGWIIWQQVEQYIRKKFQQANYQEIKTPQIVDFSLWEKSGHSAKYSDAMFKTESENRKFALKPMNCPCHVQVFNKGLKSYRDLPIRLAEFGSCHRNEPSGALHGLMRVRGFVQDDGHIFCTDSQLGDEVKAFMKQALEVYKDFGFNDVQIKLATRPKERIGDDKIWDRAEQGLQKSLDELGLEYQILPGEGAFYGPKIELHLADCLKRTWQCGTIQLDFFMPERLGAGYIDVDSQKKVPIMLHRAILGSMERFIGMLLEHYAGKLPLWLAPVQVVVMPISDKFADYATKITKKLQKNSIRAVNDLRNEKIGFKIREHTLSKASFLLIIGEKEVAAETISVRSLIDGDLGVMAVDKFISDIVINNIEVKINS